MAVAEKSTLDLGSLLTGISGVTNLLTGTSSTTKTSGGSTTQTSGLDITEAGRKKMIQDLLAGSSGLAATAGGQRSVGLYNSSTNQQLVNDLLDRVTSSVQRDTAKTVTNTTTSGGTQTTETPARVGLGGAAALAGGAYGAKKLYDLISGGSDAASAAGVLAGPGADVLGSVASVANPISDLLPSFGGIDFLGGASAGFPGLSVGMDLLTGDGEGALGTGAGYLLGNSIMPGIGGPIGSVVSQILPVDSIVSSVGDFASSLFGGSVVCTELLRQGLMSKELYNSDLTFAVAAMDPVVLEGYRFWGIPLVRLMKKSPLVTRIAAAFAVNRAHYIAAKTGLAEYSPARAIVGSVINMVGVPACWVLGKILKACDHRSKSAISLLV